MWTTIAMWGGVAGLFISIFAIIILYLTRKNILDILDKDVILFGRNFEIKKSAIVDAFKLVDEIQEKGDKIILSNEFNERAKRCYNELLCVMSDVRIADEFYNIAIDNSEQVSELRIANFKIECRKDIGLNVKKANAVKRIIKHNENGISANEAILKANSTLGTGNINNSNHINQTTPSVNNQYRPNFNNLPNQANRPLTNNNPTSPVSNTQINSTTQSTIARPNPIVRPNINNPFQNVNQNNDKQKK